MTFPSRFRLPVIAVALCALLASCGDDPVQPGSGGYTPPSYDPELLSLDSDFFSVCGAGTKDLYAIGNVILHHDGSAWDTIEPPREARDRLRYAQGFPNGDLVVSDGSSLFFRENGSWVSSVELDGFNDLWGTSSDNFYANTWDGLQHFDGASWSNVDVDKQWEIRDIGGDEQGQLLMCGSLGRIDRTVGGEMVSTWFDSTLYFRGTAATASGRLYVATDEQVFEVVGSELTKIGDVWNPLLRSDGDQLFVVGEWPNSFYGVKQYDGSSWHEVSRLSRYLYDFWAGHGDLVAAGDDGYLWHRDASGSSAAPAYPRRGAILSMVTIDDAVYAIGYSAYRYQKGSWTNLNKEYLTGMPANCIDGRKPNDIYAVGDDMVLHYDGVEWRWVNSGLSSSLNAVWVEPNGEVVAVGVGPTILEFDGREWSRTDVPINVYGFNDVTGAGDLIVAVGDNRLTAVRRQGEWYIAPSPTKGVLTSVWAVDATHVYASSYNSNEIAFFDGEDWSAIQIPETMDRTADIWGTAPNNLFLLDFYGNLVRFDGHNYVPEKRVLIDRMYALTGNHREILIAGNWGVVAYRR